MQTVNKHATAPSTLPAKRTQGNVKEVGYDNESFGVIAIIKLTIVLGKT